MGAGCEGSGEHQIGIASITVIAMRALVGARWWKTSSVVDWRLRSRTSNVYWPYGWMGGEWKG